MDHRFALFLPTRCRDPARPAPPSRVVRGLVVAVCGPGDLHQHASSTPSAAFACSLSSVCALALFVAASSLVNDGLERCCAGILQPGRGAAEGLFIYSLLPEQLLRCGQAEVAAAIEESLRAAFAAPGVAARAADFHGCYDPGCEAAGELAEDEAARGVLTTKPTTPGSSCARAAGRVSRHGPHSLARRWLSNLTLARCRLTPGLLCRSVSTRGPALHRPPTRVRCCPRPWRRCCPPPEVRANPNLRPRFLGLSLRRLYADAALLWASHYAERTSVPALPRASPPILRCHASYTSRRLVYLEAPRVQPAARTLPAVLALCRARRTRRAARRPPPSTGYPDRLLAGRAS